MELNARYWSTASPDVGAGKDEELPDHTFVPYGCDGLNVRGGHFQVRLSITDSDRKRHLWCQWRNLDGHAAIADAD